MPHVIATDRPLLWAVTTGNETLAAGLMELGGLIVTGNDKTLLSDVSELAFLGKVAGKAGSYNPLPDTGWLEAGEIYGYNGGLVMVRQSHNRTEHAPADVPALFTVYRANAGDVLDWVAGERVEVGTRRTYGGKTYEAIQAHQTQTDWQPPNVPALWKEVVTAPEGVWAYPVAYTVGQRVTYNSVEYECISAHTSNSAWTPPATPTLWKLYVVVPPTGAWSFPVVYKVGDLVTYQGNTYQCRQAHTSQSTWTPTAVPALWLRV